MQNRLRLPNGYKYYDCNTSGKAFCVGCRKETNHILDTPNYEEFRCISCISIANPLPKRIKSKIAKFFLLDKSENRGVG